MFVKLNAKHCGADGTVVRRRLNNENKRLRLQGGWEGGERNVFLMSRVHLQLY